MSLERLSNLILKIRWYQADSTAQTWSTDLKARL